MTTRLLILCFAGFLVTACGGDSGSGDDALDCRSADRACPEGSECIESANGMFGCVRIMVGLSDASAPDGDAGIGQGDGGATPNTDGGGTEGDASVRPLVCIDICTQAIDCLYTNEQCRALTPGEERDVIASCEAACEAGDISAGAVASEECPEVTAAVLTATPDLATLCGISAEGQPCRTGDGVNGVCIDEGECTGGSDPTRCLGEAVCCTGISCTDANDRQGECVGQAACDGQMIEAECPGMGTACCVAYQPAGAACESNDQCSSSICADEMLSGRVTPNGFCEVSCETDMDCGDGRACVASGDGGICFERCAADTPCRDGWFCAAQRRATDDEMVESVNVCLTDCRVGGCGREGVCNADTGICELMLEEPDACQYECAAGEVCTAGRCLRADNSCDIDYHCEELHACVDGTCQTDSFAPCNPAMCSAGQTCVPTQNNDNFCLHTCVSDNECPVNMGCEALLGPGQPNICYYTFCERGQLNGACTIGAADPGTCRPLGAAATSAGICLQAGTSPAGGECDSQADPRNEAESALGCAPGSICSGDTDDPLDPTNQNEARGVCRSLCPVGGMGVCGEGESCVQLGRTDDPNTAENELFNFGMCYESDCNLLDDSCGEGSTCQPWAFGSIFGGCRATGEVGLGGACVDNTDCGANTICGNAGSGLVCIAFCSFMDQDCPWGQSCIPINGGAVAACL